MAINESVPKEFMDNLRLILRRERIAQEFSQTDVANAIGCSYTSLIAWELGRTNPSWDRLRRWADALGYKVDVSVQLVKIGENGQEDDVLVIEDTPDVPRVVIRRDKR